MLYVKTSMKEDVSCNTVIVLRFIVLKKILCFLKNLKTSFSSLALTLSGLDTVR